MALADDHRGRRRRGHYVLALALRGRAVDTSDGWD